MYISFSKLANMEFHLINDFSFSSQEPLVFTVCFRTKNIINPNTTN